MDPLKYDQIVRYKTLREYPVGMTKVEKNTFRRRTHTYDIEDGELYYIRHKGTPKAIKTKVVKEPDEVNRIFADFHASTTGAHRGQKKTRDAISSRFYWPGMCKDIKTWVINGYLTDIVQNFNRHPKEMAGAIDSLAMTDIWKGKSSELKLNPKDYTLLLGVINEKNHWLLMVIFPSQGTSLFFDPFGESDFQMIKCFWVTRAFLRDKGCNISNVTVNNPLHPRSKDRSSSGVFILKFAESILKGEEEINFQTSDEELTRHRFAIAKTLLRRDDDLNQRSHIYGEDDSDMLDLR